MNFAHGFEVQFHGKKKKITNVYFENYYNSVDKEIHCVRFLSSIFKIKSRFIWHVAWFTSEMCHCESEELATTLATRWNHPQSSNLSFQTKEYMILESSA